MDFAMVSQPEMVNLAREGDFRALAYWLNVQLVPQGIYARVAADRPGYLLVLVEFLRMPQGDRLNRFICHRLCQLNSPLIRGVRVVARILGTPTILWDQSVRLRTPASGQPLRSRRVRPKAQPAASRSVVRRLATQAATLGNHPRQANRSQLLLLGGSAAAAFLLGVGSEVLMTLPASTGSSTTAPRPTSVQTAQGRVQVIQADTAAIADVPVTLAFGNQAVMPAAQSLNSPADITLTHLGPDVSAIALPPATTPVAPPTGLLGRSPLPPLVQDSPQNLAKTLESLDQAGLRPIGVGRNADEARRPEIIDVRGQRIAYLGYTDSGTQAAGFWRAGTNPALGDRIAEDIQSIRNQVDWVVVSYHWNQPLASYPSDSQMQLSRFAIDQGADLVVGYHPEVLQGAEIYKGRVIAYSLGDFIFPNQSRASKTDYDTALLKVALKDNQMRLEFVPVVVQQSKPAIATGEKGQQILSYLEKASALFKQPLQSTAVLERQPSQPATAASPSPSPSDSFTSTPAAPTAEPAAKPADKAAPAAIAPSPAAATPSSSFTSPPDSFTTPPDLPTPLEDGTAIQSDDSFVTTPDAPSLSTPVQSPENPVEKSSPAPAQPEGIPLQPAEPSLNPPEGTPLQKVTPQKNLEDIKLESQHRE